MNRNTLKAIAIAALVLIVVSTAVLAATTKTASTRTSSKNAPVESDGSPILKGLKCVFWDCGYMGWVLVMLPAVAVYIAKKYIFVG